MTNRLQSAADGYIACAPDDPQKPLMFMAVMEWLSASYEEDGYSEDELNRMDIESAALDYIERRRQTHGTV